MGFRQGIISWIERAGEVRQENTASLGAAKMFLFLHPGGLS
jgi:hypothetical protein